MILDIAHKFCTATENAAMAAFLASGTCNSNLADQLACDAMRKSLNEIDIDGTIAIGEGERDDAPMLFVGEKVGTGEGLKVDIAIDPLEGTALCSELRDGAMSVLVVAEHNSIQLTPDIYMKKIAVGPGLPNKVVSLDNSIEDNIKNLANAKKCNPSEVKVIILKRERHQDLILKALTSGARVKLIDDGDVGAILSVMYGEYDMYVGTGGAPEGIISSVAVKNIGGQMQAQLLSDKNRKNHYACESSYKIDYNRIYTQDNMVSGEAVFIATGVTDCKIMHGVQTTIYGITTETIFISPNIETTIKKTIRTKP